MRLKNKAFLKTLAIVVIILVTGSLAAFYGPQVLKTTEVSISHQETGEKAAPNYLGEFRVSSTVKALAWSEGKLYALAPKEIYVYSPQGKKLKTIPLGIEMPEPTGFIAAEDRFYIGDAQNQMAYVFRKTGSFWFRFPQRDQEDQRGERKLKIPAGLYRKNGVVYATDAYDNQVKSYNSDGLPIIDFSKGQQGRLGALAVTADGRLAVFNHDLKVVQLFSCDGNYIYDFEKKVPIKGETRIEIDGLKRFHLLDKGAGQIQVYDFLAYYMFSYGQKELKDAHDLAVSEENRLIYVLIPEKKRVKIWGY